MDGATQSAIRAKATYAQITPLLRRHYARVEFGHGDGLHTDVVEAFGGVGFACCLALREEVDSIGVCFIAAVSCAEGEVAYHEHRPQDREISQTRLTVGAPDHQIRALIVAPRIRLQSVPAPALAPTTKTHSIDSPVVQIESSQTLKILDSRVDIVPREQIPRCAEIAHEQGPVERSIPRFQILQIDINVLVLEQDQEESVGLLRRVRRGEMEDAAISILSKPSSLLLTYLLPRASRSLGSALA